MDLAGQSATSSRGSSFLRMLPAGELNDQEIFPKLQLLLLLNEVPNDSWAAGPPKVLQKAIIPAAAGIAKRRGYRVGA